eukprot:gene6768-11246_t
MQKLLARLTHPRAVLTVTFEGAQDKVAGPIVAFRIVTANDEPDRDP